MIKANKNQFPMSCYFSSIYIGINLFIEIWGERIKNRIELIILFFFCISFK